MTQIIPKNITAVEPNWQKELANAITRPEALLEYVHLDPAIFKDDVKARRLFPMRVPLPFANRISKGDPNDPLLRQVLPLAEEFDQADGFVHDPLQEQQNQQPGILHKYQSRVLLIVRGGCAVNCRYCFRRHFPYQENHLSKKDWEKAIGYIKQDKELNEVILSGGDPLMANDDFLSWLSAELATITHLKRLRIHTRLPVVLPNRINLEFLNWFANTRLKPIMVLHINHPNEIDVQLSQKLAELHKAGITLLNQAVLLKTINDDADVLEQLHEKLFDANVLPYYLHMLDKVQGAAHFDVSDERAREIMSDLIKRQPGFLVPKLVREIANQPGKTPLDLKLHP